MQMTFAGSSHPALRSGLLMAVGTALIAVPLAFGLGAAAIVTGVIVGVLIVALGLAGTAARRPRHPPALGPGGLRPRPRRRPSARRRAFGLAGRSARRGLFALAGLAALIVTSITRYSASPA